MKHINVPYLKFEKGYTPEECAWIKIAKEVLSGHWNGASNSILKSIKLGLGSVNHPICRKSLEAINKLG